MSKTLFVYYTHKPGGLCPRLYRAARACADRGDSVRYYSLDKPPEGVLGLVEFQRIPFPLATRKGLLFWAVFTAWLPIYLLCVALRWHPHRIVAFGAYYAAASLPVQFFVRVPIVLFLRSLTFKNDELTGKPLWLRRITGLVDAVGILTAKRVVSMTVTMRTEAAEFSGRELLSQPVLPNDLPSKTELASETAIPVRSNRCVAMGVIDRRKNFGVLVQAWKKVSEDSDIQLEIFGEGGLRHEVEADWREVAPPHKQQAVLFQGWCQTPLQNLKGVSLLVHPALHEGVSNAVLEALSLGIPVLASDISEHRELFGLPDGGGNLVNPHDPAQWAERVLAFFKQVEYQREVATIGEATIERLTFDWSQRVFDVTRF